MCFLTGLLDDEIQFAGDVRRPVPPLLKKARKTRDGMERRSEVVGERRGQVSHRGELLELVDLLLELNRVAGRLADAILETASRA